MKRESGCASQVLSSAILVAWQTSARRRLWHLGPEPFSPTSELTACVEQTLPLILGSQPLGPNADGPEGSGSFEPASSAWAALKLPWADVRLLLEIFAEETRSALERGGSPGVCAGRCTEHCLRLMQAVASSRLSAAEAELRTRGLESVALEQCITRFLSSASHDLRTPLTAIIGFAELLKDGEYEPLNAMQTAAVVNIENSAQSLLEAANNLLVTLEYRAGTLRMQPLPVAPDKLLEHLCTTLAPRAARRAVRLELTSEGPAPIVICDESLLRHSLHQLMLLAVRTAEPGSEIGISTTVRNNAVVIDLRCVGLHLPPEIVRLLEIQVNTVDSVVDQGYEAWLAGIPLAQRFLSLIGGRLNICAHSGEGAWFTLVLPLPGATDESEIAVRALAN